MGGQVEGSLGHPLKLNQSLVEVDMRLLRLPSMDMRGRPMIRLPQQLKEA